MRLTIVAVGRLKAGPERELADRYLDRLAKGGGALGLEFAGVLELAESRAAGVAQRKRDEAARLSAALGERVATICLDETGRDMGSEGFAAEIGRRRDDGMRELAFVIGGPDGLDPAFRARAALVLALGRMTFPHQIVRMLLAEQLYRATTILAGHPYHRV